MTYRSAAIAIAFLFLACPAAEARDRTLHRYCVLQLTPGNRTKVLNCIASGRCENTSLQTVRRNTANTHGIIKWRMRAGSEVPAAVADVCVSVLTHAQALELMETPEWSQQ